MLKELHLFDQRVEKKKRWRLSSAARLRWLDRRTDSPSVHFCGALPQEMSFKFLQTFFLQWLFILGVGAANQLVGPAHNHPAPAAVQARYTCWV